MHNNGLDESLSSGSVRGWRKRRNLQYILIFMYLLSAITANTAVSLLGPAAMPLVSFFNIPFDLSARDALHEIWEGKGLTIRMAALTIGGSFLSWLFCSGTPEVCLASGIAFLLAGAVNWGVYSALKRNHVFVKMATSNVFAAITDAIVFPVIAFGSISYDLFLMQAGFKIVGGLIWAYAFSRN